MYYSLPSPVGPTTRNFDSREFVREICDTVRGWLEYVSGTDDDDDGYFSMKRLEVMLQPIPLVHVEDLPEGANFVDHVDEGWRKGLVGNLAFCELRRREEEKKK
jgi:hypothetical protein